MYEISDEYTSPNHDDREGQKIDVIVLHASAGTFASDIPHLCDPAPYNPETKEPDAALRVSCHYYITKRGNIYQLVHDSREAFHAGASHLGKYTKSVNNVSLGVELENKNDGKDTYPDAQIRALTWLVEWKARQYSIPFDNIVTHAEVATPKGRKNDPLGFPLDKWRKSLTLANNDEEIWGLWGTKFPLYDDQKHWGIQQAWYRAAAVLGQARSDEIWPADYGLRVFENGIVMYDPVTNKCTVSLQKDWTK